MKVVYIAGPYRAPTAWQIEKNIRSAEAVALAVWRAGAVALCPHNNTRFFQGEGTDELWIEGTLELLRRCDAILLLPDWGISSGSRGEEEEAGRLKLPRFYAYTISDDPDLLPDSILRWLRRVR